MSDRIYSNDGWKFAEVFDDSMVSVDYDDSEMREVRIPHTVKETPFNYFDESIYQMVSGYRKVFVPDASMRDKKVFLTFEGAAHQADVFLNGKLLGTHACGYTAFTLDVTDALKFDVENVLTVRLDSRENLNIPPFGHVVDYMTYGGIYRDVYFTVKNKEYIEDVFVKTKIPKTVHYEEEKLEENRCRAVLQAEITVNTRDDGMYLRQTLERYIPENGIAVEKDSYSKALVLGEIKMAAETMLLEYETEPVQLWDVNRPALYILKIELLKSGEILDTKTVKFGFREAVFKKDGFYLNGRKLVIRGLNRHQSFPYVGYAMPESMQRMDADILKKELGVNAVRTSHYPQSHYFIDECDELGLLVFMEFPGWQHIGDIEWKKQAVKNLEEMILQYRNHTSIIIWGVRINESADDDSFYEKTNARAHELDDYRPTGGVRASKKSHLLEDVYTYNDFVHDGSNAGCEKKEKVTSNEEKPYLITEYNGHMFPTKNYDCEEHRMEHAIRHVNVLNSVGGENDISGCFGWCMFDYNTHKDFGSGDRICYHGVMDMFRNPKMAALVYECQAENQDILEVSSSMDIGEHPGCNRGDTWIFTNADSVKMYKNDIFIKEFKASDSPYKNLKHGPILIDDFIGNQISENEQFPEKQAEEIKRALNVTATRGLGNLPLSIKWIAVKMMLLHHMKPGDAVELYNRYIGDWGGAVTAYRFEAVKNGKVVKTIFKKPAEKVKLEMRTTHSVLEEKTSYDVSEVRIRALDENGNVLNYFEEPVVLTTEGPLEIIGPKIVSLRGGMTGTYVRTTGVPGKGKLFASINGMKAETIQFEVEENNQ